MRARALLLALVLFGLLGSVPALAQDGEIGIKIREAALDDDGTVRLTVQPVGPGSDALTAEDLVVQESGTPVEAFTITPIQESNARPVAVALVIDVSGSMEGQALEVTKAAATGFVERVSAEGVDVLLLSFSDTPTVLARAATDSSAVLSQIAGLEAGGETSLYDAIVMASQELSRLEAQPNMVVFSDGADTVSTATIEEAIIAADGADVPVSAVTLVTPDASLEALDRIAGATGGTTVATGDTSGLEAAFTSVATGLTTQYVIQYSGDRADLDELDLVVRWSGGTGVAEDAITVINPRIAPPSPIDTFRRPSPGILGSSVALVSGVLGAFAAVFLVLTLLFVRPGGKAGKFLERDLTAYLSGEGSVASRSSAVAQVLRARAEQFLTSAPRPRGFDERLQHRLDQAAWPLRTTEFLSIQLGSGLVVGLVGLILAPWWVAPLAFLLGAWIPWLVLDVQRSRRRAAFLSRFPDTLQLLAGSLRAGYGVLQAIDAVGRESGPPTSEEFSRVLTESRLGVPLDDALDDMADRLDAEDVRWVVLAIKIQREVGGNLAELLSTVAQTLREREALRRQIKVLSAEGKLSAIILIVLPFLLAGYLTLVNTEYVRVLVESTVGWAMIIGGAALMAVGVVWIRNLIKIEV